MGTRYQIPGMVSLRACDGEFAFFAACLFTNNGYVITFCAQSRGKLARVSTMADIPNGNQKRIYIHTKKNVAYITSSTSLMIVLDLPHTPRQVDRHGNLLCRLSSRLPRQIVLLMFLAQLQLPFNQMGQSHQLLGALEGAAERMRSVWVTKITPKVLLMMTVSHAKEARNIGLAMLMVCASVGIQLPPAYHLPLAVVLRN